MFKWKKITNRVLLLAPIVAPLVLIGTPVAEPIQSLDETVAILSELGLQWNSPGVPIIVFVDSGCSASRDFEAALEREPVCYLRVDVAEGGVEREVLADLGRNHLGTVATWATPTTVVGTRVIRGNHVEEVLQALAQCDVLSQI